jgi:hypothetical protein
MKVEPPIRTGWSVKAGPHVLVVAFHVFSRGGHTLYTWSWRVDN